MDGSHCCTNIHCSERDQVIRNSGERGRIPLTKHFLMPGTLQILSHEGLAYMTDRNPESGLFHWTGHRKQ